MNLGTLSDFQIITEGLLKFFTPHIQTEHISPASFDIPLLKKRYRIGRVTLPKAGETIESLLPQMSALPVDEDSVFERNVSYLVELPEIRKLLPKGIYLHSSPKSSTGRVDVHARLLADGIPLFDTIPEGFVGKLWLVVTPRSFPVIAPSGEVLVQLRAIYSGTRECTKKDVKELLSAGLFSPESCSEKNYSVDGGGNVTCCLSLEYPTPGYVCHGSTKVLDLSKRKYYSWKDFFEPVSIRDGGIELLPGSFYILSTKEQINIPANICGEMVVSMYKFGDFRAHYAGFFDPGFSGFATLEVRSMEPLFIKEDYPIAHMKFEYMSESPNTLYGDKPLVHYQKQHGPTLAKYFKG